MYETKDTTRMKRYGTEQGKDLMQENFLAKPSGTMETISGVFDSRIHPHIHPERLGLDERTEGADREMVQDNT